LLPVTLETSLARSIHLATAGVTVALLLTACAGDAIAPNTKTGYDAHAHVTATAVALETAAMQVTETVQAAADLAAVRATMTAPVKVTASASLTPAASALPVPSPTASPFMPVIADFRCDPCSLEPGETATLRWQVEGAVTVTLDGQGVAAPGTLLVQPDQTTTYRLVAVNERGRSEKMVTVEVRGLPIIHYFTCLPCQVMPGESSTLSWDLSGGTAAYLDGQGVTAPGSTVVVPDRTATYRLEAVGARGSVERLVTVTVVESGNPDTVNSALSQLGYKVRAIGYQSFVSGEKSIAVVMAVVASASDDAGARSLADQYYWGLKTLYDNYPGQLLSVGLYDGRRYTTFVTVDAGAVQSYLRGEMDGQAWWRAGRWDVWDDWNSRWLPARMFRFGPQNFLAKDFSR
jgi:hypothetical protein